MAEFIDRSGWTLEQMIEHACSLAIGYGAGRDDLLEEYKQAKEFAIKMARQTRVRMPWMTEDDELAAADGDEVVAGLLKRWQEDRSEYFTNPTLEIVAEYALWREERRIRHRRNAHGPRDPFSEEQKQAFLRAGATPERIVLGRCAISGAGLKKCLEQGLWEEYRDQAASGEFAMRYKFTETGLRLLRDLQSSDRQND